MCVTFAFEFFDLVGDFAVIWIDCLGYPLNK